MYLEKISVYGFKTFRKETEILFSPKVTCIVGPNGSGKSNIVDGIRWALGEQRISLLRASDSTDLIFSGSAFKKPISVASVKLVFNNEDRSFPDINTPRVIVERRIYRSREGGYFVNNNPIRLQDVMRLFYSAGMYNHTYSIVSQGRIEEILLAKSEQKRALIEQVAGVGVFKKRRKEALKKLSETEQNLLRVKDILSELRKRVEHITSEAKKAHMYYFLTDRLKQAEGTLLNYSLSNLKRQVETVKSGIMDVENEEKMLIEKLRERKEKLNEIKNKSEALSRETGTTRNKREEFLIEEAKLKEREIHFEEQKNQLEEKSRKTLLEIERLKRKLGYIQKDIKELNTQKNVLQEEINKREKTVELLQSNIKCTENEIAPLLDEEKKNKEIRTKLQEVRVKKERILSSVRLEIQYLEKEKNRIELVIKNAESSSVKEPSFIESKINNILRVSSEKQEEREKLSEEIALLKYKISEIKEFIDTHTIKNKHFKNGTLGSILDVPDVRVGLETELDAFILSSIEEIYSKRNGHFLIKENLVNIESTETGQTKPIIKSTNSPYLNGIYISETLKDAVDFFKKNVGIVFIKKIITKDGFVLLSPFEIKINSNLLVKEKSKELENLVREKELKEQKRNTLSNETSQLKNTIKALQNDLEKTKEKLKDRDKALIQKQRIPAIEKEIAEKESTAKNIEKEIKTTINQIEMLSEKEQAIEKKKRLDELKNSLHNEMMALKDSQFQFERIASNLKQSELRLERTNRNIEELEKEHNSIETSLKNTKQNLFQIKKLHNKLKLDMADIETKEKELKEKTDDIEHETKRINLEISRMEEQKENILKKTEKQHISLAEKTAQINNIKEKIKEKNITEREITYNVDERKIKIEIASIKAKVQSLGAIDFTSVEEEESIKEEFKKKEDVYNDVLSSKKELESFIKEMENRAHSEFEKTLEGVEKYFSVFFRRMFKGGEADIERMLDENNEVKGIELNVRLPGKKRQSLPLLSGGEKSLTALAFLFAIFKVRPAPFYVLDEADAALDEENVVKFGELLGEESNFAQFIVITHNKETMQKANILYGITMEEDGISKVVSLKLV